MPPRGSDGYRFALPILRELPQPQLLIPLRRDLIAPGAVGRCAAAVAGDDAGLLALDVAIDAGHPGIDLVGQQSLAECLDVIGPGFHARWRRLQPRQPVL